MTTETPNASEIETAVMVLSYLVQKGFNRSVAAFRRDAKQLLKPVKSVPAGIRPLPNIITEYVALKEAAIKRASCLQRNPALQEIDNIIVRHAQCQKSAQELAAQCQQPLEGPVIALDLSVGKQAIDNPGADAMHDDALDGDIQQAPPEPFPGAAPAQTRLTPRKLHRKAAPKRKRVGGVQKEAQDAAVPGDALVGSLDLLNQPINERILEQLLAGEWQGRFAEGLASCINNRLGPHEQHAEDFGAADMTDLPSLQQQQQQGLDDVDVMNWVSALTEEPSMAALLEPIVAHLPEDHNAAAQDASTAQEHDQSMSPPVFREQHHMQQQGHDGPQHSSLAANLPLESDNVCSGSPQHVDSQQQTPGPWVLSSSMPPAEQSQGGQRQQEVRMHSYAEAPACAAASGAPFSEGSHWAGAAQSMQPDVQNPSTAIQKIGEQLQEQAEVLSDDSDSEDDIQVRPMNKHALLSSLMGSGGAEDAIESFVASLKY